MLRSFPTTTVTSASPEGCASRYTLPARMTEATRSAAWTKEPLGGEHTSVTASRRESFSARPPDTPTAQAQRERVRHARQAGTVDEDDPDQRAARRPALRRDQEVDLLGADPNPPSRPVTATRRSTSSGSTRTPPVEARHRAQAGDVGPARPCAWSPSPRTCRRRPPAPHGAPRSRRRTPAARPCHLRNRSWTVGAAARQAITARPLTSP